MPPDRATPGDMQLRSAAGRDSALHPVAQRTRSFLVGLRSAPLSLPEFVVMMAASMTLYALAIDAILPALPIIGRGFGVQDATELQYIVTLFVMGGGFGQMLYGPLADRLGRRPVLLLGLTLYVAVALLAACATTIEMLLALRLLEGLIAAAVSVIPLSIVRDRYAGAEMARVMSLTIIVFLMVPALAPALGQALLLTMSWRGIFVVLGVAACLVGVWIGLRLPETLHPNHRRSLHPALLMAAGWQVLSDRTSIYYTLGTAVLLGSLMAYVSSLPQIFAVTFQLPALMPVIFALCAGTIVAASFFNARIVERVGMRRVSHAALIGYTLFAALHTLVALAGYDSPPVFCLMQAATLGCFGLAASNFNAIAMFHMGNIAGSAASVQGLISMVGAALVASLIGHQWNGQVTFLPAGTVLCGVSALTFVLLAERGKLFYDPEEPPCLKWST
jgi:DHA1 family bicyclomycin/chloramphenicol resistance-like MFS transporter